LIFFGKKLGVGKKWEKEKKINFW